MTRYLRKILFKFLDRLRTTRLRLSILRFLSRAHNFTYHSISFFALKDGIHPKHKIQKYEEFFIQHISPGETVIDLGCGIGHVSKAIAPVAGHVYAIDLSSQNIGFAIERNSHPSIQFIIGDALTYPFPKACDAIIMSNVLEHIEKRVQLLTQLKTVAPKLLIRVPMVTRDWLTVFKKNIGVEYRLDNTHYIEYTEALLRQELEDSGWTITEQSVSFGELYVTAK